MISLLVGKEAMYELSAGCHIEGIAPIAEMEENFF